jgi:leucyl aminopeptidase
MIHHPISKSAASELRQAAPVVVTNKIAVNHDTGGQSLMKIQVLGANSLLTTPVDLTVLTSFTGSHDQSPTFVAFDEALEGQLSAALQEESWQGKMGEVFTNRTLGQVAAKRIALIGIGEQAKADINTIRLAAANAIKQAMNVKATTVTLSLPTELTASVSPTLIGQSLAEGAYLANYRFEGYARDKQSPTYVETLYVVADGSALVESVLQSGIDRGESIGAGVNLARDLVNTPSNLMTPTKMAEQAMTIAERYGMSCEVLDESQMKELGMGALLAVAQGSVEPPKMIAIRYQGRKEWDNVIGLVGKGITFDSGGVSIKTASGMENMKTDMGGGASVLGTMEAIGRLKPEINVLGVVPATENMPSGSSYKPGDVIQAMTGKTIEVLNTDAEGRIALADGVGYAKKLGATQLIDLATLTGAALVALGKTTTAALTNDEAFLESFLAATKLAGEKAWQLPTFDEYKELIQSDIADVKNIGGRDAGVITAGLFIREFVEETPWIHLDIAGTAYNDKGTALNPQGATGVMVRSLAQYLLDRAEK